MDLHQVSASEKLVQHFSLELGTWSDSSFAEGLSHHVRPCIADASVSDV